MRYENSINSLYHKKTTLIVLLTYFFMGCSEDTPEIMEMESGEMEETTPEEEIANQAPNSFNLLFLENNTQEATVLPNLEWEAATDPNSDPVTYDVYLDTVNPPTVPYVKNIVENNIQVEPRLSLFKTYSWKVTAKDDKGESTVFNFTTRNIDIPETAVVTAGPFSARRKAAGSVFNDKMWLMGGSNPGTIGDIWFSENGTDWLEIIDEHPFPERSDDISLVFNDKIWLLYGFDGGFSNGIWALD